VSLYFDRVKRLNPLFGLALVLGALAYLQSFHFEFIYDDFILIVENPAIQHWSKVPHYFAGGMFDHLPGGQSFNFYRPLFLLWLRLNHAAFWLAAGYWHLASLLAHLVATFFAFKLLKQVSSGFVAGCVALLFVLHPAHLEPVSWISAGSEALFTASGLASLYLYSRYRSEKRNSLLAASTACFLASLLFKETALVFLPLLLAFEFCYSSREWKALKTSGIAFFAIALLYLAVRHAALGVLASVDHSRPFTKLLVTWPSLIWFYFGKLLWPFKLSYLYDVGWVDSASSIRFIFPAAAILCLVAAAIFAGFKERRIWFAAAVILIPIIPPLLGTWVYNEYDLVHDRYLYLPVMGICLLLAMGLERLQSARLRNFMVATLTAAYFATLLLQGHIYTNNFSVFARATDVASGNPLGWDLLGEEYMKQGLPKSAIVKFQAALDRDPGFWLANFNLGRAYFESNDPASAEICFKRASQKDAYLDPPSRGRQYFYLGLSQFRQHKLQKAEESLRKALENSPRGMGYNFALGQVLEARGLNDQAIRAYEAEYSASKSSDAKSSIEHLRAVPHQMLKSPPLF
jgi:tetratricopeptide (TPR) repeat protein